MTSVSRLSTFLLRKALPEGGVYSSEEEPPKDTTVFYTDEGTEYWIRGPQDTVDDDKVSDAMSKLITEATAEYNAQYNKVFIDMHEDFEKRLKDPSTKEFRQMRNLVRLLVHPDYDDEDEDIGDKTVEELLKHLGNDWEGNKGPLKFSIQAGFIDKYAPDGTPISDGTTVQKMNPLVKYRVLQSLMGSRYPGNDGVEIPTHHFRALVDAEGGLVINGNRNYILDKSGMQKLYKHVMGLKKADGYNPKVLKILKEEVRKFKRTHPFTGKLSAAFLDDGEVTNASLVQVMKQIGGN